MNSNEIVNDLAALVGNMVAESGELAGFNAVHWVTQWLDKPARALGGKRPRDYVETPEGLEQIKRLLKSVQSGSYR